MIELTFTKAGQDDIVLTENDLFDFNCERACFGTETFELGGVVAKSIYLLIDNNTQRFSRGTFANTRIRLELDGNFYGYYNAELPKRRNGVIELTAYDDMIKLDCEYPDTYAFPAVFPGVYAVCLFEAGIASEISLDNIINNGVTTVGMISYEYTDYIYANSCRQLVAGMAEWNGGFCSITENGKLQIDKFMTTVSHTFVSSDLLDFDYSDETITFTKIKTSQKNKTYEVGTDNGYTLVFANQYISYGLKDSVFETFMTLMYNYYNGFTLTPMTFTLAEPDFTLQLGDRISVYDAEEDFTIYGNISKIVVTGNCSMEITCGGFGNVASGNNYNPTSKSETAQAQTTGSATAKRLQTNSTDCYVETSGTSVYHYDNAYSSNNRYMYEALADGSYQKYAYDGSNNIFSKSIANGSCYIYLSHNGKTARLSVNIDNGGFQYHGDNCEIIFDGGELYCRHSGYTFKLSPGDLQIEVGGVEVVDYGHTHSGRLYLRAPDGIYANGTQIG